MNIVGSKKMVLLAVISLLLTFSTVIYTTKEYKEELYKLKDESSLSIQKVEIGFPVSTSKLIVEKDVGSEGSQPILTDYGDVVILYDKPTLVINFTIFFVTAYFISKKFVRIKQ